MTQYPDTEVYLVSYCWGTCGSFISSLIYDFLFNPEEVIPFSKEGNSHERLINCHNNWNVRQEYNTHPFRREVGFIYDHISPINSNKPLILLDHRFPVFDNLFSIYPKCKNIIISFTPKDVPRIKGNTFYKLKLLKSNSLETVQDFNTYKHNIAAIEEKFMNLDLKCPVEYSKNINVLPMYDIIHHKEKTLMLLSQVTQRPITKKITEIYNQYLEAQDELVRTKMPWVTI